jgi:hypothetical protein
MHSARGRVNRVAFWNSPLNPAGARYLGKTRKWNLIRRGRSEPPRLVQGAFAGRSWSAGRGQQLKPTGQRSRHEAQLETLGGQIGSICAVRVSSWSCFGCKTLPMIPARSSGHCSSCAACILAAFRQKLHLSRCSNFQSQLQPHRQTRGDHCLRG